MIARLRRVLGGPRAWMMIALLLSRATGFLTGLVLARTSGAAALGLYATVMNTASSVVAPMSQPLINNATLMAHERSEQGLHGLWRAQLLATLCALAIGLPLFSWLFQRAVDASILQPWQRSLAHAGAAAVVLSQLGTPLVAALLHGEGRFRAAGQWTALAGGLTLLAVVPVVTTWGLEGALMLGAVAALLGWSLLSLDLLRRHRHVGTHDALSLLRQLGARLLGVLPSIATTGLAAAVNWLCTIYLIHLQWGAEGVGVVGIGLQWSTLMLIPVTSWGGMTLKLLGESHLRGERGAAAAVLRAQIARNVGVTVVVALVVVLGAGLLEHLYGLRDSALPAVLYGFAAASVVTSANNVFERLWWAAGRQRDWFVWNCAGLTLQVGATVVLLPRHLAFAGVGVLVAALLLAVLSALALPRYLAEMRPEAT